MAAIQKVDHLRRQPAAWNPADEGQKKAAREGVFSLQGGVKNWTTSKDNPKEGIV
jgi:formylglycine-generating enzyme required for sulfatase activity